MSAIAPTVQQIQTEIQAGHLDQAEALCHQLIEAQPENIFALSFLAFRALDGGDFKTAVALGRRATAVHPQQAVLWQNLGIALHGAGDFDAATQAFRSALDRGAPEALLRLYLGRSLHADGLHREGALSLQRGFDLDPTLRQRAGDENAPAPLRSLCMEADGTLKAYRYEGHQAAVAQAAGDNLPDRFHRCLRAFDGLERLDYADPQQRPNYQYYPELTARPFWNPTDFPWVETLEAGAEAIRRELEAILAEGDAATQPYVDTLGGAAAPEGWRKLLHNSTWSSYHLLKGGERVDAHCKRCPETAALLDRLPLAQARGHAPEAFFSILRPGTHIPPHVGLANTKLVVHLPLIVPDHCAIRVGGEQQSWEAGRVMIFDDSYVHEAWNRSEETRVVLITEVWNPDLTAAEQAGLDAVIGWDTDFYAEAGANAGPGSGHASAAIRP